jgi:hypothetical protein
MEKHKHSEILHAYADGKTIQMRSIKEYDDNEWWEPSDILEFINDDQHEFRVKPSIIIINGIEVPEPLRDAPPKGTLYFVPDSKDPKGLFFPSWWDGSEDDFARLEAGVVHLSKENASIHAEAFFSFTRFE